MDSNVRWNDTKVVSTHPTESAFIGVHQLLHSLCGLCG